MTSGLAAQRRARPRRGHEDRWRVVEAEAQREGVAMAAWQRRSSAVGRSTHSSVCAAAGSRGPGGSIGPGEGNVPAHDPANLAQNLVATAERHADRLALKLDDAELTYGMLDEASARVAGLLRRRASGRATASGSCCPNVPYFPIVYYGVLRRGAPWSR